MDTYVTGASGFIGSHLVKKLGQYKAIAHENISTTKLEPFRRFFFLSSYGNLFQQIEDDRIFQANISDLLAVINQLDFSFKSFVYVSTSSVKLSTQSMYSRTKRAAEEILLAVMEKHDVPISIIRPFSVTGVGEQDVHLIPNLIKSCLSGESMILDPTPSHDYIDVDDVVAGILSLSDNHARGIFELGNSRQYSNLEVMALVEKVTGKKAQVQFVSSLRPYDSANWGSTNFKARSYGWLPKKSLEQSITEMVDAYVA